jgi:hypothetical protein
MLYTDQKMLRKRNRREEISVLLIAPSSANLDTDNEISYITSLEHLRVRILPGNISVKDFFSAAQGNYDIVHFAVHSTNTPQPLIKINGEYLTPGDVTRFLRLTRAKLVFFNSCDSGIFATYATQEAVDWSIFTNRELPDAEAWKMPILFYECINRQIAEREVVNFPKAYKYAATNDATYGITANYEKAGTLLVMRKISELERKMWLLLGVTTFNVIALLVVFFWLLNKEVFIFY